MIFLTFIFYNLKEIQEQNTSAANCEEDDQIENSLDQSNELPKKTVISYAIGHFYNVNENII